MPRQFDRRSLPVDRNPLHELAVEIGKLPPVPGPEQAIEALIGLINDIVGIDLSSWDNFLASLVDGKGLDLPGLFIAFTALSDLVTHIGQAISDAFNGIPAAVGGLVTEVWHAIDGLLGIGRNAQTTADDGWSQIAALNAAVAGISLGFGTSGADKFDGPAITDPGPLYDERHWGSAANKYYRDGTGKLRFPQSGFFWNFSIFARNDITFAGSRATTAVYTPTRIAGGQAGLLLLNRFDFSAASGYCAMIRDTTIQAGYIHMSSGSPDYVPIGGTSSYSPADGEYWEFDLGETDGSNDYMFRVRRNGLEVHTQVDTSNRYPPNPAFVDIGAGGLSGSGFPSIFPAPTIDTFSWYERA